MPHDLWLQRLEHLILQIVVVLVQLLLGATDRDGGAELCDVVVNGDAVHVVHAADEEVDQGVCVEGMHEGFVDGADEFGLEADEDVEVLGVLFLEAGCFGDVGLVARGEGCEGSLRVIELRR